MNQFRYLSLLFVAIVHLKRIQGPLSHFNSCIKTEYENLLEAAPIYWRLQLIYKTTQAYTLSIDKSYWL